MSAGREEAGGSSEDPILIELGKHKKKRIKELLRGEGQLLDEVTANIEELKAKGTIPKGSRPVIVVVREKSPRRKGLLGLR